MRWHKWILSFTRAFLLKDRPMACSVEPTLRCNLRCPGCYERRRRERMLRLGRHELSLEQFEQLCLFLRDGLGIEHCTITGGGEPLLEPRKVELAVEIFDMPWLVTNGTLEIPDFGDKMPTLFVSLDGPPEMHDAYRGRGTFQRMRRVLRSSPMEFWVTCTLNRLNRHHIEQTVKTAIELGASGIAFDWLTVATPDAWKWWVPHKERLRDLRTIEALRTKYEGEIVVGPSTEELLLLCRPLSREECLIRRLVVCVDPYGQVKHPCIFGDQEDRRYPVCETCGCHVEGGLELIFRYLRPWKSHMWAVGARQIMRKHPWFFLRGSAQVARHR